MEEHQQKWREADWSPKGRLPKERESKENRYMRLYAKTITGVMQYTPRDKGTLDCFGMYCTFRLLYAIKEVIQAQCEDKILILEQSQYVGY